MEQNLIVLMLFILILFIFIAIAVSLSYTPSANVKCEATQKVTAEEILRRRKQHLIKDSDSLSPLKNDLSPNNQQLSPVELSPGREQSSSLTKLDKKQDLYEYLINGRPQLDDIIEEL